MNQTAMRITASLPLWYLLSTMSGRGPGTSHSTPPPPALQLMLSSDVCCHHRDVLLPVKYDFLACFIQ